MRCGVLGELVVKDGPRTVRVGRSTRAVVLAALVCRVGRPVAVEELVELVWGEDAPPTAATMVHGAVARLRRELAGDLVGTTGGGYVVDVDVDAVTFEGLVAVGPPRGVARLPATDAVVHLAAAEVAERSTAALALWRGAAYAGIGRPFARDEAERLEELRRRCVEQLADAELALGRPERALSQLTALVGAEPTRERAAAQLMRVLHRLDRQAEALSVYRRVRATLVAELGLEPGPALHAAEAEVLGGRVGAAQERYRAATPTRLPAAISSFVGRGDDIARVTALLRDHLLTTLTGPGGSGKTRLAVEVARGWPDAVFVDLARTTSMFDETVAEAFGIRFDGGTLADAVAAAVADEPTLVVLDNCEHLLDRCAALATELLVRASDARILATSRERLGVPGEQVHPVAPLPLPAPHARWEEVRASPAVRLFADRAAATRPGFAVTPDNAAVVAEICRRLDGLPLAVELAAARTSALPLLALADRLHDGLLAARTAAPRHRSLTATVAWSHDLLPEPERVLFRRLGVFPGGFDLAAVAGVTGDDPALPLAHLVECSLVQADDGRFRLLATTRAFARATTTAAEQFVLRRRHAHHYRDLARRAFPHLHRAGSGRWLADLHRERDNLRAALEWAAGPDGEPEVLVGLGECLWHYWDVRGSRGEGLRWLSAALAVVGPDRPERMALLSAAALLHLGRAEFAATEALAAEQGTLAVRAGDRRWEGDALSLRATVAWARGAFDRAQQLYEDGIAASLHGGDVWRAAMAEAQLARLHRDRREPDAARALADRAAAHADAVGEELARGLARDVAASIEHRWGDRAVAKRLAAEALAHYRLVGYREGEASALHLSGRIALADGDRRRATRQLGRALRVYRRIGHRAGVAAALTSLADVAELSAAEHARHGESDPRAEAAAPGESDAPTTLAEVAERIPPTAARLRADAAAVLADIGLP